MELDFHGLLWILMDLDGFGWDLDGFASPPEILCGAALPGAFFSPEEHVPGQT